MSGVAEQNPVLLVEDDLSDILLTRRALKRGKLPISLHTAQTGEDALAFLRREGTHTDAPRPRLIILDLNLRGLSGHEVLQAIKSDAALCAIPVVVFTTSHADADVAAVYAARANGYVSKPIGLSRVIQDIVHYFVNVSVAPV